MKIMTKKTILVFTILISAVFLTSCEKNFSISSLDVQKLTQKAQQLMDKGDFNGAIARLESINDLNPNIAANNYNLGIAYYNTNQYEKAVKSLNNAVKLDENLKDAYYTLAVIHEEIADKEVKNLKKTKDNKEKSSDELIKITQNYKYARDNYTSYLNIAGMIEERDQILDKIKNYNKQIEKYSH